MTGKAYALDQAVTKQACRFAGVVRDERYLDHIPGFGHIESPERLGAIYERLDKDDVKGFYRPITPRPATREELLWNHAPAYIESIARTAGRGFRQLDPDTVTSAGSWQAACLAAGGVFSALDAVCGGVVPNAFALVRPPGHHAERSEAKGFCIFNNVALGAYYAKKVLGYSRVLIVDWDLHHGNGTQNSFYNDPSVLYFSTHQYPCYPGSGSVQEIGDGEGRGFTVNVPLASGAGDEDYAAIFRRVLLPVAGSFSPDVILVSAGFDIYEGDPLGGMKVSIQGLAYLARVLLDLASKVSQGRIIFCLEGGYNLYGLSEGVFAVIRECAGKSILRPETLSYLSGSRPGQSVVAEVIDVLKDYWPEVFCKFCK